MSDLKILAIDLAKNIFQIHGTDEAGNCVLTKRVRRNQLLKCLANLPKCLIGIEACGSAYHWAREFGALGHEVKIMAPKYVKPYVVSNKNDSKDAEAIAEAVTRPKTKFVPLKSIEQTDIQCIHRVRQQLIKQRTAIANQIRGLLMEYGITIPKGISHVRKELPLIIQDGDNNLTVVSRELFNDLYGQFREIDTRVNGYDEKLECLSKTNERCKKLMKIGGIGPITATAIVATIGDASVFKNGRHLAAFLGLVPKQYSSGEKVVLGGISKKGNRYLRTLLIHGARAIMRYADKKTDKRSTWIKEKKARSGFNSTAVALANKLARYVFAVLSKGEEFNNDYA